MLRRQGLLEGIWYLDDYEGMSPWQAAGIDPVYRMYPHLNHNALVAEHLHEWLG